MFYAVFTLCLCLDSVYFLFVYYSRLCHRYLWLFSDSLSPSLPSSLPPSTLSLSLSHLPVCLSPSPVYVLFATLFIIHSTHLFVWYFISHTSRSGSTHFCRLCKEQSLGVWWRGNVGKCCTVVTNVSLLENRVKTSAYFSDVVPFSLPLPPLSLYLCSVAVSL